MKQIISDISSWVLVILFFGGLIIMYGVLEASVFNGTYFMIGMVMAGVSAVIFWGIFNFESGKIKQEIDDRVNKIKAEGEKIEVDLTKCEVISSNWSTTSSSYDNDRIEAWNTLSGDSDLNVYQEDHHASRVIYKTKHNGKEREFFSHPVRKDIHTLKMLLEYHKKCTIYVSKDGYNYLFELDFLESN